MKSSCKHVSIKLSEAQDHKLSLPERFFLKFHLLMCRSCSQVEKQMKLLSHTTQKIKPNNTTLTNNARQRILNNIKNNYERYS